LKLHKKTAMLRRQWSIAVKSRIGNIFQGTMSLSIENAEFEIYALMEASLYF
jgi:hypothetical protein